MRTCLCLGFLLLLGLTHGLTVQELPAAIEAVMSQPEFDRMEWGIMVDMQLDNGQYETIYAKNARQLFTPASNNKVITTAPAFLYLGESFRIQTPFVADTKSNNTNACLLGRGDASVVSSQLDSLASSLLRQGITSVDELVFDDSYFPTFPPAWEWEDVVATYGAQPSSFILTQNAVSFSVAPGNVGQALQVTFTEAADEHCMQVVNQAITVAATQPITSPLNIYYRLGDARIHIEGQMQVGQAAASIGMAVLQPAERFECATKYAFAQKGIQVTSSRIGPCSSTEWPTVATITSQYALVDTMNYTLQESDNLFAECFLRTLGAQYPQTAGYDAQTNGMEAVRTILNERGVDITSFKQDDGSGLSRHNLVSPQAMAEVLGMMSQAPGGATYRTFLPVAGESGTLSNRFVGTPAQGKVQAKTGTVSGVASLSGYVDASNTFPQMVFSIITNFSDQPSSVARSGIDQVVVLLTQLVQSS